MNQEDAMDSICTSCHCRKTFPWANCKLPFPQGYGVEPLEKWFASALAGGCSLCQLGTAVAKEAISKFGYDDAFALSSMFDNEIDSVIRLTLTLNCGSDENMTNQVRMVILARDGSLIDSNGYHLEPYNPILNTNATKDCIEQAQEWMKSCSSSHSTCHIRPKPLPTRIVDVSVDPPRLQITNNELGNFVALSHCWGFSVDGAGPPMTRRNSIGTHVRAIDQVTLPRNFKDAIAVTLALGFTYIWIDSLCIVQDDGEDWAKEAASMKSVYENAALVLATSSSDNVSRGILRERSPYKEGTLSFDMCGVPGSGAIIYRVIPNHAGWEPVVQGPIDARAWCFQERLMARRYLSFGSHEMLWECLDGSRCECGYKSIYYNVASGRIQHNTQSYNIETLIKEGREEMAFDSFSLYAVWARIIRIYSRRQLTHQSDKLVAITAVADRFREELEDQYLWGLWRRDFLSSLCWFALQPGDISAPNMPSWTWASISARISMYFEAHDKDTVAMAEVLKYPEPLESQEPNDVATPTIVLRGPMVEAIVSIEDSGLATLDVLSAGHAEPLPAELTTSNLWLDVPLETGTVSFDHETTTSQRALDGVQRPGTFPVYLMSIFHRQGKLSPFLILGRSQASANHFRRLGFGRVRDPEGSETGFSSKWTIAQAVIM
ncbi:heterokaryon incompatibility protein [Colletotrichum chrysophilum]|uniref:Heterokaryon incompatibility protein n=1 Tax=Colletotrichum chrysophilum TaxID=1836956 RepID=A0AAD9A460_9PEZI|nr:heterokaryon incompatibility protein [Colletotrichum chrysophilum]